LALREKIESPWLEGAAAEAYRRRDSKKMTRKMMRDNRSGDNLKENGKESSAEGSAEIRETADRAGQ
jgi:hypothetical protein